MIQSNVMPFRGSGIMKKQKKWYVGSTFLAWCSWDVGGKKKLLHDWTTGDTQDSDQGAGGNFRSHGYTSLSRGLYLSIKQKIMHNFLTHYKFSGGRGIIWSRALMFLEDYVKDRFFFFQWFLTPLAEPFSFKYCTEPWFSKCGPQTSSISVTWEFARCKFLRYTPDLLNQKLWGSAEQSML